MGWEEESRKREPGHPVLTTSAYTMGFVKCGECEVYLEILEQ